MSREISCVLLVPALLGGCASSASTSVGGGPSSLPATVTATVPEIQGRAQASEPLPGATFQFFALDGTPLPGAQGVAGGNGQFRLTAPLTNPLPNSFRLVVKPPASSGGQPYTLAAEVRNYDGSKWIGVNYVTNLVSYYLKAHPELSLADAEERVRRYLAIPSAVNLGTGLDADRGVFSRSAFGRRAQLKGGVEAYTSSLVPLVDTSPPSPVLDEEPASSPLGAFATGIFKSLAENAAKSAAKDGFGWAVSLAGFNIGGPSNSDIIAELNAIQNQLTLIQQEIAQQTLTLLYAQDQTALEPLVNVITQTSNQVSLLCSQFATPGFQAPVSSAPDQPLINQLQNQSPPWDILANQILDYLLGRPGAPNNMMLLYRPIVMQSLQADSPAAYLGYPLRSNSIGAQLEDQANFYLQVVMEAANLLAETNHLVYRDFEGNFTSNAVPIMLAKASMLNLFAATRLALAQVTAPLASDQILVDVENGLSWYLVVQDSAPYFGGARFDVTQMVTGPYGAAAPFQIPTVKQLDTLRARLNALDAPSATQAMPLLGFTGLDPSLKDLEVWAFNTSSTECDTKVYHMNTGSTSTKNGCDDTERFRWLACLPYPGPAEQESTNPLLANGAPGALSVGQVSPTQLRCQATQNVLTSGGSFTIGINSHQAPVTTLSVPDADITNGVSWSSSNPSVADISNLNRQTNAQGEVITQPGLITWHPNVAGGLVPVTFTATWGTQTASLNVTPPTPAPTVQLKSIQVMPTNLLYGNPPRNEYYHATGFYTDDTAVNLDNLVTWSVESTADGSPIPANQAGFTTSQPNLLIINRSLATSQLTVKVTYQGVTGTSPVVVPIPISR